MQAAQAAARTKKTYLRALYYRIAGRRGKNRAVVAVARTILQIAYHVITKGTTYQELGAEYFDQLDRRRTTNRLVKRLTALGFVVELTTVANGGSGPNERIAVATGHDGRAAEAPPG